MKKDLLLLFKTIKEQVNNQKKKIVVNYLITLTITVLTLYNSILNKSIIDEVFYKRNIKYLFEDKIYIVLIIFITSILLQLLLNYLNIKIYTCADIGIKRSYYKKILESNYFFLLSLNNSELYYRMFRDISNICKYGLSLFLQIIPSVLYFIGMIVVLVSWSKSLAIGLIVIILIQVCLVIVLKKPTQKIIRVQTKTEQKLVKQVNVDYRDVVDIKLLSLQDYKVENINKSMDEYRDTTIRSQFFLRIINTIGDFINNIWGIIILIFGSFLVYKNTITVGEYMMFSSLSIKAIEPMVVITQTILSFQEIRVNLSRYKEYMNNEEIYSGSDKFELKESLDIDRLRFFYPNSSRMALNVGNVHIKGETIVGLLGVNGSGKTTLMYILSRIITSGFYGKVKIDGKNIDHFSIETYRNSVFMMPQKPVIFEASLQENLTLFDSSISTDDILEFKYTRILDSLINRLPHRLKTGLSDEGSNLSVGEKQKISLVRMFLRKPKLLLLDEPFTGLDINSQKQLTEMLTDYKKEYKAIIIIASHQGLESNIIDQRIVLIQE